MDTSESSSSSFSGMLSSSRFSYSLCSAISPGTEFYRESFSCEKGNAIGEGSLASGESIIVIITRNDDPWRLLYL